MQENNNIGEKYPSDSGGILVFGMPRSGTTWVGKIFDSHPATVYRHEPDSWKKMADVPLVPMNIDDHPSIQSVQTFYHTIAGMTAPKVCAKTPIFPKAYLSSIRFRMYQSGILLSQLCAQIGINMPVLGTPQRVLDPSRLVWKSIESLGRLGLVLRALPDADAILLLRHPCGFVASMIRGESQKRFEDNRGASEDYGILRMLLDTDLAKERGLSLDYLQTMLPEERLAWRWVLFNDKAIRDTQSTDRCRIVRYEDVCNDPVALTKDVFAHVGLNWSLQTETFVHQSTLQNSDAYYSVFKDPKKAAGKWREELDPERIERILAITRDTVPGSMFLDMDI